MIKNIGNIKRICLKNALTYTIEKSYQAFFFDTLRDIFKQNLFILSQGKLDYTNEASLIKFSKTFHSLLHYFFKNHKG